MEKPNAVEIFDCATLLGFQTQLEMTKAYCRDYWIRGRVRVRLFDEEGKPVKEEIPSRTFVCRLCQILERVLLSFLRTF